MALGSGNGTGLRESLVNAQLLKPRAGLLQLWDQASCNLQAAPQDRTAAESSGTATQGEMGSPVTGWP